MGDGKQTIRTEALRGRLPLASKPIVTVVAGVLLILAFYNFSSVVFSILKISLSVALVGLIFYQVTLSILGLRDTSHRADPHEKYVWLENALTVIVILFFLGVLWLPGMMF